jgi:hypothetical protein
MKRNVVPAKQINHAFKVGLACSLAFGFAAGQIAFGATLWVILSFLLEMPQSFPSW